MAGEAGVWAISGDSDGIEDAAGAIVSPDTLRRGHWPRSSTPWRSSPSPSAGRRPASRKCPTVPILAITSHRAVSRRLCPLWGAHSVLSEDIHTYEEMVERASSIVQAGTTNDLRVVHMNKN